MPKLLTFEDLVEGLVRGEELIEQERRKRQAQKERGDDRRKRDHMRSGV